MISLSILLILAGYFSFHQNQIKTNASVGSSVTVDELWNNTSKSFNGDSLGELYSYLTGKKDASYEDANNMISGSTTAVTASTIRSKAGNKNVTVKFGGLDWTVTYLTRTRTKANSFNGQVSSTNGDLILTLWLADTDGTTHTFTDGWRGASANYGWETPAHMYGSSYLRSVVLNAGGVYSAYNGTATAVSAASLLQIKTAQKDSSNKYAAFTMTQDELQSAGSATVSLTDYIVSPRNVAYQEKLHSMGISTKSTNYAGAGYGVPSKTTSNGREPTYRAKAHYADWADDYIWVPAMEEMSTKGPWKINSEQMISTQTYWSRTARSDDATSYPVGNCIFNMGGPSNQNWKDALVSNPQGVRPALHLNLTKAAAAGLSRPSVSESASYSFNGIEQTVDLTTFKDFNVNKMYVTNIERKADGETGTVAPKLDVASPADMTTKVKFTSAGTYYLFLKAKKDTVNGVENSQLYWNETEATEDPTVTKIEIKVDKAKIETPGMGVKSKEYSGEELTFTVTNFVPISILSNPLPTKHLKIDVVKTEGGSAGEKILPQSDKTVDIVLRNAGKYKATFTISETANYEWKESGTKEIEFEIVKKKLSVSYVTNPAGGTLSWGADDKTTAKFTITGIYSGDATATPAVSGDSVGLQAKIAKDEDATYGVTKQLTDKGDGTQEFELDTSVFGGAYVPGHYPISFEFTGGTHDGNYDLTNVLNAMSNEKLVIGASGAGLNKYDWKYTADGGSLTPMPVGKNLVYAYNESAGSGVKYKLFVDDTSFADANIEVDTSYNEDGFIDGYKDNVKARAGTYTAKVRIKVTDPTQYAFSDGSTEKVVEYTFTIDKATIDTTAIKWQYTDMNGQTQIYDPLGDGIPWKSTNYTLTLSPLPDGVTVNPGSSYSGNQAKAVGEYTASCTSLSYDTNNYNTIATPTVQWKIKAQEIEINNTSWIMDAQTATTVFYLPHLNSPYDGIGILYRYYYLDPQNGATLLNDVSEILSDGGITRNYYVEAYLSTEVSTDGVTTWDNALKLKDTTTQPNGACTMGFTTGDNRTPVSVTLNGNPVMYDGKEHGKLNEDIFIRVGSTDMLASQFHIDYYLYDETAANHVGAAIDGNAPVNAGKYVIVVSLSDSAEADYFLNATTFEFEILPYEIDMSGVRWGYVDGDGNEVVYNPSMPPVYTLDGGAAKEHELKLVGFPKGDSAGTEDEKLAYAMFLESKLEELIEYSGNKQSGVGSYTAKYTLDETRLSGNFKLVSMPDPETELRETQGWKIGVREILAPQNNKDSVFSGEGYDLLKLAGLNLEDLGVYYEIGTNGFTTVDENNEAIPLDPGTVGNIVNAGVYKITFTLKDASSGNVKWLVNGSQRTSAQTVTITINKLKVTVTDWEGEEGNQQEPWNPIYNNGENEKQPPAGLIENEIRDAKGELVEGSDWSTRWNETFKQKLKPTAGNENNIEFEYADGVEEEKSFTVGDDPSALPATGIARPTYNGEGANAEGTGKTLTFNGETQDFTPEGLEELIEKNRVKLYTVDEEGNETAVDIGIFQQRNAGTYKVIARINGNYKWSDTNDKTDAVFEFEIGKAEISGEWGTDEKGMPILTGVSEKFADKLVYEYRDAEGKVVAEEDLTKGKEYTVSVRVSEEESGNIILRTESGEEAESLESMFTVPGRNTLANMIGLPEDFPLIQVALTVIFLILFLIFLIMWIRYHKQRKAAEEIIEEYQNLDL